MSFFEDDEILEDFLVEAGEILEQLSEQLVALERQPDDTALLHAIFRGFHTVKGGAGFLQLLPLVDCCHVTENLFDLLRNGQRQVTPELMDTVLQVLDTVIEMFASVKARQPLVPADPALMQALDDLVTGRCATAETSSASATSAPVPAPDEAAAPGKSTVAEQSSMATNEHTPVDDGAADQEMTDEEFEQLLAALDAADFVAQAESEQAKSDQAMSAKAWSEQARSEQARSEQARSEQARSEQTQSEQTQSGQTQSGQTRSEQANSHASAHSPAANDIAATHTAARDDHDSEEISEAEFEALLDQLRGDVPPPVSAQTLSDSAADDMTDAEFESLLDQLHGKGTHNGIPQVESAATPPHDSISIPTPAPAPTPTPTPTPTRTPSVPSETATAANAPRSKKDSQPSETVRVDTQRLDDIMNMVGELVLVRNRLVRIGGATADELLAKTIANLDLVTADLQTSVMKTRMQPIKKVFGRFPRLVRDLARSLQKEVVLELRGEDTDLDKNLVEALADPLIHLVRNAIDHGIELPDVRERNGKPRHGQVLLSAEQEGDHILLIISDDGNGMDPDVLRRKAVEKGLMDAEAAARLSRTECFELIFAPGFSTRAEVSDVSGRGVGMDVVKTKISQLNGSVFIDSSPGRGSRIDIKVPLTLAIMPTLMIMVGQQTFALPLASVSEIFNIDLAQTNLVDGQQVVTVRDKALPLFHLRDWLGNAPAAVNDAPGDANVVIVTVGAQRVGFVVDTLIGQEEVVIKPLGRMLHGTPGMAGATITGDGGIAIILDIPGLLKQYAA